MRAGYFKNNLSGELAYRSFVPASLPPDPPIKQDEIMVSLLIKAHKQLAVLNTNAKNIPHVPLFITMYIRKEALLSSQIEGTQATLEDVLDPELSENTNKDVADVIHYIDAMTCALGLFSKLPLCNRLLREAHAVLMQGSRGEEKNPGEFRRSQNWIGGSGSTIKTARYIPPSPDDMLEAMSKLEKYMNSGDDKLDDLIQAALIHYQFETIHPFLDGNGRIGRLLIIVFLISRGVLSTPALYISYHLKKNRVEYYDRMSEVRRSGNYEQWICFFLQAVYECAKNANVAIEKLTELHHRAEVFANSCGRGALSVRLLLYYLEAKPIINVGGAAKDLGLSFSTVSIAVNKLLEAGFVKQTGVNRRNRRFSYEPYLAILRDGTE